MRRSSESSVAYSLGQLDQRSSPVRVDVTEPASIPAGCEVGDDVELLPRVEERLLEREVVARCHDQLVRHASLAQDRRERCEEPMHACGWQGRLQQRVQLVVEWPEAPHHRDVLGDPREVRGLQRVFKALRELNRQLGDVRAEHWYEAAGEHRLDHLPQAILAGGRAGSVELEASILPQDRAVELLERRAWLDPSSSTSSLRASW